jgi:hypothetical protein
VKKSEAIKLIADHLNDTIRYILRYGSTEYVNSEDFRKTDASFILLALLDAGMLPPSIGEEKQYTESGSGYMSDIHKWETEKEDTIEVIIDPNLKENEWYLKSCNC